MHWTSSVRITVAAAAVALSVAPLAASALSPALRPLIRAPRTSAPPAIDGALTEQEWRAAPATPIRFRLPNAVITGTARALWDTDRVYVAVELATAADEVDVVLDRNHNARLDADDRAYLAWANGRRETFRYEPRNRGFIRDATAPAFAHATRSERLRRTFEFAIPHPRSDRVGLALKTERRGAGGQFDTWPTPGVRDPITKQPNLWTELTLEPARVTVDRQPPTVALVLNPDRPLSNQTVGWRATASDGYGLDRIELIENDRTIRTCTAATTCEHSTGPYAAGTVVRASARAIDRHGNAATAVQTFTVQPLQPTPTNPPPTTANVPAQFTGTGNASDRFTSAASARDGRLHLGTGPVGIVWGEQFSYTPNRMDAIALAWAGIRHGVNPNYLAALAIKESRYDCLRYDDGCFQIEAPTFGELKNQFPRAFRTVTHNTAARSPRLAPQTAAYHFRFTESLFRRWYDWDAFMASARDPLARMKLLTRAYNRGAWGMNIGRILKTDRARCIAATDILTCYDNHDVARDHTQAIAGYVDALLRGPAFDADIPWTDLELFLREGVLPMVTIDANWDAMLRETRSRYDALRAEDGNVTFARDLPRLFTWLAGYLPPLEQPQRLSDYYAPV